MDLANSSAPAAIFLVKADGDESGKMKARKLASSKAAA